MNVKNQDYSKWVAMWGSAVSVLENRPESYAKDITLRYPIYCPFNGDKIRLTFDNYCTKEPISIERVTVLYEDDFTNVTFGGEEGICIADGGNVTSDEIDIDISRGKTLYVSFYLKEFTKMRSSVYLQGPLSKGQYSLKDATRCKIFDKDISRSTNNYYFLSNISIHTTSENKAIVCYGDSITAQDWPDYLQLKLQKEGFENISVIRRATSGSRILRQYSCITYESYGLMGKNRFLHEVPTDGADAVIIQQGINDIIHPVGEEINPFRPMSDLPTLEELEQGMNWYIDQAKNMGLKVVLGTLLPIEGWRTYADFREVLKNDFNDFLRSNPQIDGCIDFDKALRDEDNHKSFMKIYDSGDHLHPSAAGYEKMAAAAFEYIKQVYR